MFLHILRYTHNLESRHNLYQTSFCNVWKSLYIMSALRCFPEICSLPLLPSTGGECGTTILFNSSRVLVIAVS